MGALKNVILSSWSRADRKGFQEWRAGERAIFIANAKWERPCGNQAPYGMQAKTETGYPKRVCSIGQARWVGAGPPLLQMGRAEPIAEPSQQQTSGAGTETSWLRASPG